MTLTKEQIKNAAMGLEPRERESLAEELLLSLGEADRDAIDAAWLEEAQRRDEEYARGKVMAKPANEVLDRLMRKAKS